MMRPLAATGTCALLVLTPVAFAGGTSNQNGAAPELPRSVRRFLARGDEPVTSYRALRRLEARNPRYKKHGWLEAWASLDPDNGFTFEVVSEGGSSYVRNKVLRKALEREREAYLKSEATGAAIDPANYEFIAEVPDAEGLVIVDVKPRRKDALLIVGRVYLKAGDADLVRVEGELARNPSIWTRRVHLSRRYARIGDVRVPIAMETTAQVVLAGESSFTMTYDYAVINGLVVGDPQPCAAADPAGTLLRPADVPIPERCAGSLPVIKMQ